MKKEDGNENSNKERLVSGRAGWQMKDKWPSFFNARASI
jgi:hypothetical protein